MTSAASTGMAPTQYVRPLRLSLRPRAYRPRALDGGWWPHSLKPETELPGLVTALASRGAVTRITLNPAGWASAPASLAVDGHTVSLDWVPTQDEHLVVVTVPDGTIELLVVPPRTSMTQAASALAAASHPTNSLTASQIIEAASTVRSGPAIAGRSS